MESTKTKYISIILLLVFLLAMCGLTTPAFAEGTTLYTDVMEDLHRDSSFNEIHYPSVDTDYSLKIIQLAESGDKELFVYVYQPCAETKYLVASSINISVTVNDSISFSNYKLQLLNSYGVFYKYLVKDFTVQSVPTRYYAISSIYRPFDESIDQQADHDNTITEVNYNVSKQYCFSVINGNPYCSVVDIETIVVTDKFVGFVRYSDGFKLYVGACDSHFVAFNTDRPMEHLLEADVYYTKQKYSSTIAPFLGKHETFGEKNDAYAYLSYDQKVEHNGGGWFAGTYTWTRIETVEQFIAENSTMQNVYSGALFDVSVANNITEEGIAALRGKQWVLRFAETSYSLSGGNGTTSTFSTMVGDVTILRLKFETDGVVYNLGVIDNKQTGGKDPINKEEIKVTPTQDFTMLLILLGAILLLILIILVKPIGTAIACIFKAIWFVISAPFKLLISLFKKHDNKDK